LILFGSNLRGVARLWGAGGRELGLGLLGMRMLFMGDCDVWEVSIHRFPTLFVLKCYYYYIIIVLLGMSIGKCDTLRIFKKKILISIEKLT
jgi:hypothetical protein